MLGHRRRMWTNIDQYNMGLMSRVCWVTIVRGIWLEHCQCRYPPQNGKSHLSGSDPFSSIQLSATDRFLDIKICAIVGSIYQIPWPNSGYQSLMIVYGTWVYLEQNKLLRLFLKPGRNSVGPQIQDGRHTQYLDSNSPITLELLARN